MNRRTPNRTAAAIPAVPVWAGAAILALAPGVSHGHEGEFPDAPLTTVGDLWHALLHILGSPAVFLAVASLYLLVRAGRAWRRRARACTANPDRGEAR